MEEASDCVYVGHRKAVGGGDHFIVEDLLDFSNGETEEDNTVNGGDESGFEAETRTEISTGSSTVTAVDSCNSSFSGVANASLSGELCEPVHYNELAELEWLSNFVEESFSSKDPHLISGHKSGSDLNPSSSSTRNSETPSSAGSLTASVPGKARSKRSRAASCNWSSRLLFLDRKPAKRREITKISPLMVVDSNGRKCLHCATAKTPQWRTGPMGPKTLCNACGVRYKSGRLMPEYRPAASPTFVMSKHSNSHRKVMEMRRKKEMQNGFVGPATTEEEEVLIQHELGMDFRQLV